MAVVRKNHTKSGGEEGGRSPSEKEVSSSSGRATGPPLGNSAGKRERRKGITNTCKKPKRGPALSTSKKGYVAETGAGIPRERKNTFEGMNPVCRGN